MQLHAIKHQPTSFSFARCISSVVVLAMYFWSFEFAVVTNVADTVLVKVRKCNFKRKEWPECQKFVFHAIYVWFVMHLIIHVKCLLECWAFYVKKQSWAYQDVFVKAGCTTWCNFTHIYNVHKFIYNGQGILIMAVCKSINVCVHMLWSYLAAILWKIFHDIILVF